MSIKDLEGKIYIASCEGKKKLAMKYILKDNMWRFRI